MRVSLFRELMRSCCNSRAANGVPLQLRSNNLFSTSAFQLTAQHVRNCDISIKEVNNRNPRNLEKLRIGEKPKGWQLERENKCFWNKVTLDLSTKHITASVTHYLGKKPVNVSTKEWCLKKYLYSTNDASASRLVGEVLARRCLQAGITEVACYFPEEERRKEKVNMFITAVEQGGVALSEPPQVDHDVNIHHVETPETPWAIHEDVYDHVSIASTLPEHRVRRMKRQVGNFEKDIKFED